MRRKKNLIKKQRIKKIREIKSKRKYLKKIRLKCKNCKRLFIINTSTPEIYTDIVRQNWKCLLCKK